MKLTLLICCIIICMNSLAQVVYKTVKADGTVVYSGTKTDGAVEVKLSAVNSVVVPALNSTAAVPVKANNRQAASKNISQYKLLILSPEDQQTLRDNAGKVNISAKIQPKVVGKYHLWLNNEKVSSQNNGQFSLENLNRGAHQIKMQFTDNSGKVLARSKEQTFYLHKASALINAN